MKDEDRTPNPWETQREGNRDLGALRRDILYVAPRSYSPEPSLSLVPLPSPDIHSKATRLPIQVLVLGSSTDLNTQIWLKPLSLSLCI